MNPITLIDCNNFFVSCERLFRPDLEGRPVIVLSSNDGCVISRSEEAKALGFKMGEPYFKVRELCEKNSVAVFSSNFELYRDLSRRVMATLRRFSDEVEVYSIDEAFLSIPSMSTSPTLGRPGTGKAPLSSSRESSPYLEYDSASHSSTPCVWSREKRPEPDTESSRHCEEWSTVKRSDMTKQSRVIANTDGFTPGLPARTYPSSTGGLHPLRLEASQVRNDGEDVTTPSPCGTHFHPPVQVGNDDSYHDFNTDLNHDTYLYGVGKEIRETVLREVGIPVSVGVAPTKTLAKVATHYAKKPIQPNRKLPNRASINDRYYMHDLFGVQSTSQGVCVLLEQSDRQKALSMLPVGEVWGVGFRLAPKLERLGITTAGKLAAMDNRWIQKHLSIRGLRTVEELRGTPCFDVGEDNAIRKSLLHSQSFSKRVEKLPELRSAVAYHARKVAETLRAEKVAARNVYVTIRTSRHGEKRFAAYDGDTLPVHTNDTFELVSQALAVLTRIYRPGFPYAKAGVQVSDIIPEEAVHPATLFQETTNDMQPLMQAMDALRHRYGAQVLRLGVEGTQNTWQASHNLLSPRYTTEWRDILQVTSK